MRCTPFLPVACMLWVGAACADTAAEALAPAAEIVCRELNDKSFVCEDSAGKRQLLKPSPLSASRFRYDSLPPLLDNPRSFRTRCIQLRTGEYVCG